MNFFLVCLNRNLHIDTQKNLRECNGYFSSMPHDMLDIVVKFQPPSYNTFWDMIFFLVGFLVQSHTDAKRWLWAHHAWAQVGSKKWCANPECLSATQLWIVVLPCRVTFLYLSILPLHETFLLFPVYIQTWSCIGDPFDFFPQSIVSVTQQLSGRSPPENFVGLLTPQSDELVTPQHSNWNIGKQWMTLQQISLSTI